MSRRGSIRAVSGPGFTHASRWVPPALCLLASAWTTGCFQPPPAELPKQRRATVEHDLRSSFEVESVPFEDRIVLSRTARRPSVESSADSSPVEVPRQSPENFGTRFSRPEAPSTSGELAPLPYMSSGTTEGDMLRSIPVQELGADAEEDAILVRDAHKSLEEGKMEQAITQLNRATAINPRNGGAYHLLGMAHMANNAPSRAIPYFDAAIHLKSNLGSSYLYRGIARVKTQDNTNAIGDLDEAAKLDPEQSQIHVWRAIAHLNLRHPKDATAAAERAVQLNAKSPDAFFVRSLARMQSGRHDAGREDFKHSIDLGLDPNSQKVGRMYFPGL